MPSPPPAPLHLPLLRAGRPYRSLDTVLLTDVASGEPVAEVSQANPGLIARDLTRAAASRRALGRLSAGELVAVCREAARRFTDGELPAGEVAGEPALQSPEDYVRRLSATTGMPHALARANMEKIRFVLAEMETVLGGLTRGLDLAVLDAGWALVDGRPLSYLAQTDALGVVLPSNSPGVHSLWIPAIPLKVPLALKPGSREPWTPLRIAQALLAAGCPPEAIGFYPSGHAGANEILLGTGRSLLFGDRSTVGVWADDPGVQLHGPGWSKVLLGEDRLERWPEALDLMVESVAANGGRSCINASGVWVPGHGRQIAAALAERLAAVEALPLDHPQAALAAFPDAATAHRVSDYIDQRLAAGGAEDLTAPLRGGTRVAEAGGCTFLLPTVIWCDGPEHPLAQSELLFPFVSVVEVPQREMLTRLGPSLVLSALTDDPELIAELLACRAVERLNVGDLPTSRVSWDQPHEGNLFEHLYRQRAFQSPELLAPAPATGESARP